MWNFDMKLNL